MSINTPQASRPGPVKPPMKIAIAAAVYRLRAVSPEFLIVKVAPYGVGTSFWTIPSLVFAQGGVPTELEGTLRAHILSALGLAVGSFSAVAGGPYSPDVARGATFVTSHVSGEVARKNGHYADHRWVIAGDHILSSLVSGAGDVIKAFNASRRWSLVS